MALFTAGQVLTAAQLNALFGLGSVKRVTATGNVTSGDLPQGQTIIIIGWSGGGGSGATTTTALSQASASAGGGSSPLGITVVKYSLITFPFVVTIGAGGIAGAVPGGTGGTGGSTTVVDNNGAGTTYLSITGGVGGQGSTASGSATPVLLSGGGVAGSVTTATFSSAGSVGGSGELFATGVARAGAGAHAPMGGGRTETSMGNAVRAAIAGSIPGGGAAGGSIVASTTQAAGAAGGRGEVWFIVI